ncbi:MAG: transcriptional regulator [Betaproteobacteria bacterium HGW-Betaproteobacteria-22]|nr:MAG: transcriptional regulator [Betaproteobacteria bacterium HGW-Betaproteobacteria-22]
MDVEKFYKLHELLRNHRTASPMVEIMNCLDCSESTAKRAINFMRNNLDAPIEYDREYRGYRYSKDSYELPGLWFSVEELLALVSLQKLLAELGPGLLDQQLAPLKLRIEKLLVSKHLSSNAMQRIKLLPIAARIPDGALFQVIASTVLNRRRLEISYHARGTDTEAVRIVSPQRLAHYRDNWYLDAWCHQRNALRSFALDRIRHAKVLDATAQIVTEETLDAHYAAGYGIFAGAAAHIAILRFTPARARWVADERWHPQQQGEWLADGAFQLQIPYADHRELMMDIMRHLPEVEVIAPKELKQEMIQRLQSALKTHIA